MSTTRLHLSRTKIAALHDVVVPVDCLAPKPPGLWYGLGDAWIDWCRSEHCEHWIDGTRAYHLDVSGARILKLRTAKAVRAFAAEWAFQGDTGRIVWPCVAMNYDGIEIAPYQWACRLDARTSFYYGWDCASGVIWNASRARILPGPLPPDVTPATEGAPLA